MSAAPSQTNAKTDEGAEQKPWRPPTLEQIDYRATAASFGGAGSVDLGACS
jgi:hypothetical protein